MISNFSVKTEKLRVVFRFSFPAQAICMYVCMFAYILILQLSVKSSSS